MPRKKLDVSRRDFLKLAGAATATGLAARHGLEPVMVEAKPIQAPSGSEEITVTFAGDADVETLQMDTWGSLLAYQVYRAIGLTLVHYKVHEGEDGLLYYDPDGYDFVGAESAELADDLMSATWKIRQGLTFDNGKPITAHEWKKTFDWFYDRQGVGWAQTNVNGVAHKDDIQALDDWTLEMKFEKPTPWGIDGFFILNQAVQDVDEIMSHATESDPYGERWLENNVVCSGPYTVESRTPGEQLVLKARDDWWEGKPDIDRIVLQVIPDASARYSLIKKGEVDIASQIDWKDLGDLESDPDVTAETFETDGVYMLGMNWNMPPGGDKDFRKAIAYAVDWDEIVDTIFYGFATRLKTPFGIFMKGADPSVWPYSYDPDKAKEHLEKSACAGGCDIDLYFSRYIGTEEKMSVMIKDYLGQIGVNVNIHEQTGAENWDAMTQKKLPFYLNDWYSWVPDAGYQILWCYKPDSFANREGYNNPEAAALMEKIIPLAADDPDRIAMLHELQEIMADDVAFLPIMATKQIYPHNPKLHGFAYYPDSNIRWERITVG